MESHEVHPVVALLKWGGFVLQLDTTIEAVSRYARVNSHQTLPHRVKRTPGTLDSPTLAAFPGVWADTVLLGDRSASAMSTIPTAPTAAPTIVPVEIEKLLPESSSAEFRDGQSPLRC